MRTYVRTYVPCVFPTQSSWLRADSRCAKSSKFKLRGVSNKLESNTYVRTYVSVVSYDMIFYYSMLDSLNLRASSILAQPVTRTHVLHTG